MNELSFFSEIEFHSMNKWIIFAGCVSGVEIFAGKIIISFADFLSIKKKKSLSRLSQKSSQERERGYNYASKVARCSAALSRSDIDIQIKKTHLNEICSGIKHLLIDGTLLVE